VGDKKLRLLTQELRGSLEPAVREGGEMRNRGQSSRPESGADGHLQELSAAQLNLSRVCGLREDRGCGRFTGFGRQYVPLLEYGAETYSDVL